LVAEDLTASSRRILTTTAVTRSPMIELVPRGATPLLAFESGVNVGIQRVNEDGSGGPVTLLPGTAPRLASDGDSVQLSWTDSQSLRVAPLNSDGSLKSQ